MKTDNYHLDALSGLAAGVHKAAMLVGKTMGPKGQNVVIEANLPPYARISNDGATIIKALELADPIEKIGLGYLKEAVERSNNNSGDGSSTTTILLDSILEEGIKAGINNLELKRALDGCLPIIEQSIHEQTRQIGVEDIPAVARIAGENEELAQKLGEVYRIIGKDGIIHLDSSGTYQTTHSLIEGVRFIDTGYLSPYMAYDEQAEKEGKRPTKAVYKNPQILITKNKINHLKDIDPILSALIAAEVKSLVIFTDDMDSGVARTLIELQKNEKRSINILVIKAPTLWKQYVFEDFAKITGATIIEDASGTSLGNKFRLDWLGTCETLVCDKDETTIIGIKNISEHIIQLEAEGTNDAKLRLSWLTTKTAILKLGSKSETELTWLRDKATDAIFSCRAALQHGVVVGGGVSLLNCAQVMPDTIGGNILRAGLAAPNKHIIENAGGNLEGMFGEEVIDSADIVFGGVRNALGIASTLLTASSVILLPPKSEEQIRNESVMRPAYMN